MRHTAIAQTARPCGSRSRAFSFLWAAIVPAFCLAFCAGCNFLDELQERIQDQIDENFQTPTPEISPADPESESILKRTVIFPGSKIALAEVWIWDVDDQDWFRDEAEIVPLLPPALGGGAQAAVINGGGGGTAQANNRPNQALFAGGVGPNSEIATARAYFYDFTNDAWTGLTMGEPRSGHTLTTLLDNRVLIVGGTNGDNQFTVLASAELFDPRTKTFAATGPLLTGRINHAAARLIDGRILITGGGANGPPFELDTAELYDPATGVFTATGRMTRNRQNHTATTLDDGRVLIVGSNGSTSAEVYDPLTGAFTPVGNLSTTHGAGLTATKLQSGRVLILGGMGDTQRVEPTTAVAEVFDPATNQFTAVGAMGVARRAHAAILQGDGRVLICGGITDTGDTVAVCELFDPATNTFLPAAKLPRPASEHVGVFLERAR